MPLDKTASIKDVITSLQDMQGINAKADLASVVGSPATADDSMATITNTIQQVKNDLADKTEQNNTEPLQSLVDNMVVGRKWASGNALSSSSTTQFIHPDGSTASLSYLTITSLDFIPSTILLVSRTSNWFTVLFPEILPSTTLGRVLNGQYNGLKQGSLTIRTFQLTGNAVSEYGLFTLPIGVVNDTVEWIAFE